MKHHIERYIHGLGWVFCHSLSNHNDYFQAVKSLRLQHGQQNTFYRMVRTITIKATEVVTSDYVDGDKG